MEKALCQPNYKKNHYCINSRKQLDISQSYCYKCNYYANQKTVIFMYMVVFILYKRLTENKAHKALNKRNKIFNNPEKRCHNLLPQNFVTALLTSLIFLLLTINLLSLSRVMSKSEKPFTYLIFTTAPL